eukprot:SAG11_NODE_336_length_10544_cov_9.794926_11_plen_243_part_00
MPVAICSAKEYGQEVERSHAMSMQNVQLQPGDSHRAIELSEHAAKLINDKKWAEAETTLRHLIAAQRASLGDDHYFVRQAQFQRAVLCEQLGMYEEAEHLYREVQRAYELRFGEKDPETLAVTMGIVNVNAQQGRRREAILLCRWVAEKQARGLGSLHPTTLRSRMNLATLLSDQSNTSVDREELNEAERIYRDVERAQQRILPQNHPDYLLTRCARDRRQKNGLIGINSRCGCRSNRAWFW